ncbi:MAG: endonuclease, partial [Clostridia bacterium]|nr:endonuclease [Clostridia bacterium]
MSKFIKRSLASVLVLATIISLILSIGMNVSAADFSYVYSGQYIYNWGERGEEATFLSPNAKSFYEDNNTSYDILSSYSGGTGQSDAPSSKLYSELKKLMSGNHTYITSYSATKDLFKYTDCQNNGGKISSFYSGTLIGPNWGEGSWNREHTWPNSKGLGGSDEDDIMMLRPTAISENSSRGNTAYGQSNGYYHPNSESDGEYDLRGDVARIFLYVYVRWGNTSYAWGASGVMESVDVLLEWMEADPVDTWELGRNDSVESITGTRNVFVDYPELAFILFGEEIPDNMSTPSGEGDQDCGHNNFNSGTLVAATCTEEGYTLYACQTYGCNYSYKANFTSSKGHSYTAVVTAPTCVKAGYTTYTCSVCKNSYVGDNVPTIAHKYQDDTCTVCGAIKGSSTEATLSFADKANRTEFSTS